LKRICHIVHSYYLRDPRVRREAEALAAAGYEVDVVCLKEQGKRWRETVNGVSILRLPIARRRATVWRYMLEYATFFLCVAFVLTVRIFRRYDLIHVSNMPDFLVFATIFPKALGAKVLLDVHDPMAEVFMSKYAMRADSPVIRLIEWQERISLHYCNYVLTVSDVMKERVARTAGYTPVAVVLNVPDESVFKRPERSLGEPRAESGFSLLYTGTISRRYGLAIAIEAIDRLRDRIPGLKLRLVGEGDDLPSLKEMVERRSLRDVVEFLDPVPLPEIPRFIENSDVGISPHLDDVFMRLYFSTKVAEFVNMGLPTIVTSTETITRYFADDMVRYCEPGNVDSFAEAVWNLYEDGELRRTMSRACIEFGEKHSWTVEKKLYLGVVADLLGVTEEGAVEPEAGVLMFVDSASPAALRRIESEARVLVDANYRVVALCPAHGNELLLETIDGVRYYRYRLPRRALRAAGYLREMIALTLTAISLASRIHERERFDVLHVAGTSGASYFLARYFRSRRKVKIVFDQYGLGPERFAARFGVTCKSALYRALLRLEGGAIALADAVISANESLKSIALERSRGKADSVVVVRSYPALDGEFPPALVRETSGYTVCYAGSLDVESRVEYLIRTIDYIVHDLGRRDIAFTIVGDGERLEDLTSLARRLRVDEFVSFAGYVGDPGLVRSYIASADICVAPLPRNSLSERYTQNKIIEYMAAGKPIVAFDLIETRAAAGDAAVYASPNYIVDFGNRICELLDDPDRRRIMSSIGRQRIAELFSREIGTKRLIAAYGLVESRRSGAHTGSGPDMA